MLIQKTVRGYMQRKRYCQIRRSVLGVQKYGRGCLARQKARIIREERAAKRIQAHVHGWLIRKRYQQIKQTAIGIQKYARGMLARQKFKFMKDEAAVIKIQRYARGYLARKAYKEKLRKIITIQSLIRRRLAKRVFRRLKAEAKSVEYITSLNKGLENKIISLQQKINELVRWFYHLGALSSIILLVDIEFRI